MAPPTSIRSTRKIRPRRITKAAAPPPASRGIVGSPGKTCRAGCCPYAPRWQAHLGVNWQIGAIDGYQFATTAGESYSSSFQTSATDNPQAIVPGFATTDLRLAVTSPDGRWKLELFGTNLFGKHDLVATVAQPFGNVMPGVVNTVTGATVYRGFLGDPRRLGARITANF